MHTEQTDHAAVAISMDSNEPVMIPNRKRHVLGVTLLLTVACIWVISGELIQAIFKTSDGAPFFLTYYSISLFSVCLLGFLRSSWRAAFHSALYHPLPDLPSAPHVTASEQTPRHTSPGYKAIRLAAILAPFFFLANWTFNFGLKQTSVASSSTIGTLTTLFTLVFGSLLGVEEFSYVKLLAVGLVMAGVTVITTNDERQEGQDHLEGDLISILSAAVYSLYTIILTKGSGPDGDISMLMMLAFMGFFTAISAWPGFFVLHFTHLELFQVPSLRSFVMLTINGLVGTVLSDFLWAKGVVLTTPLIGSLSLSLSVPLSIIADLILGKKLFNWVYLVGAGLVFIGFIVVNVNKALAREENLTEEGLETFRDSAEKRATSPGTRDGRTMTAIPT